MKLTNELLKGKKLVSSYGTLVFDSEGNLTEPDLTEEQIESFKGMKGYEVIEKGNKTTEKKSEPEGKVKEDEKATEEAEEEVEADSESDADSEDELDYDSMTLDELKAHSEKAELDVKGTGRKGAVLRKDLIKALKEAK